jgi:hypothetical protein
MQISILDGIYTDESSDFRSIYPRNLTPVPKDTGVSKGYLRPSDGIIEFGTGPGVDRGGINWNDIYYRVMGTKLVSIDDAGTHTVIGDVGGTTQVTLDYSFDYLAIASNGKLYLYDGTNLTQVTDVDLGLVIDVRWIDGYFMTTDGKFLVVTELNDPFSVNPLKYGSSEVDPDPVEALLKLNNEIYALNRYTIEVFDNIGGDLFPFARVESAQVNRGAIGTHACCVFIESVAFVGGGRNEAISVWLGLNGSSTKISTREIDQILGDYTEVQLFSTVCESRVYDNHQQLLVHLPDKTLAYDAVASQSSGQPVWYTLTTSVIGDGQYRAKNLVRVYNQWLCGDPTTSKHGQMTNTISSHYGNINGWDFGTIILYNEGRGLIFHELELVCLSGRVPVDIDPSIYTQFSLDGETYSMEMSVKTGKQGERNTRISWLQQGTMRNWRIQKFRGTSESHLTIARLEARIEDLNE